MALKNALEWNLSRHLLGAKYFVCISGMKTHMYKTILKNSTQLFFVFVVTTLFFALLGEHGGVSAAIQWPEPRPVITFDTDYNYQIGLSVLTTSGDLTYFLKSTYHSGYSFCHLWVTDGSAIGSRDIIEVVYNTNTAHCQHANGMETLPIGSQGLLFNTYTYTDNPNAFYSTDGISATKLLDGPATNLVKIDGQAFFLYTDSVNGLAVWTTDGTPQGTQMIKKLPGSKASAFFNGHELLVLVRFGDGSSWLWKTDGTSQGTVAVRQITNENFYQVSSWIQHEDKVFFMVQSMESDSPLILPWALWSTDGSEAGTYRVFDLPYENARIYYFVSTNNLLFFVMGETSSYLSEENTLWQSDGTEGGTQTVSDASLGTLDTVVAYKDAVYWYNHVDKSFKKTTGRADGVITVLSGYPSNSENILFVQNNLLYLASIHAWVTDGETLTELAGSHDYSHPVSLTGFRGQLFFTIWIEDNATGWEIWKSDGTAEGTGVYADLIPGPDSSYPGIIGVAGGKLYFASRDSEDNYCLWAVDDPYTFSTYIPAVHR